MVPTHYRMWLNDHGRVLVGVPAQSCFDDLGGDFEVIAEVTQEAIFASDFAIDFENRLSVRDQLGSALDHDSSQLTVFGAGFCQQREAWVADEVDQLL